MMKKQNALWTIWQWTWGFPQTFVGSCLKIALNCDTLSYRGCDIEFWNKEKGMSLGRFLFLPTCEKEPISNGEETFLLRHEYGHSIQSAMLGPLYLIVVGLPSVIWSNSRFFFKWRLVHQYDYYNMFIEKNATILGGIGKRKKLK